MKFSFSFSFICCLSASLVSFRTADEDFITLLEAAAIYDERVAAALNVANSVEEENESDNHDGHQNLYPRLLIVITGMVYRCFCTPSSF